MPSFRIKKQNSSSLELHDCGCKAKGPHKAENHPEMSETGSARRMKITTEPEVETSKGRFNISSLKAKAKKTEVKIDDDTLKELFEYKLEENDGANMWSLLGPKTIQAFLYDAESKNGNVTYFNKLNSPNLGDGEIFYITKNGGLGVNSDALEFTDGDMLALAIVDLGNYHDLVDDES